MSTPKNNFNFPSEREKLRRFQAILANAQQFIGLLSTAGEVLEINSAVLESYGLSQQEVVGKKLRDTYWWQGLAEAQERLEEAINEAAQGREVQFSAQVRGASDELVPITFSIRPVRDENGQVRYLLPEARNNADLEKTIVELRQSQRLLRQANHIARLGYWTWNLSSDQVETSNELTRIFAENGQATVNSYQQLLRFVHPEDRVIVRRTIQSALEFKRDFAVSFRITRPDGEIRTLRGLGHITLDEDGEPIEIVGTVQDITEIKALENRLMDSEKRYRYLVQELPDIGVVLYDPDLTVFLIEGSTFTERDIENDQLVGSALVDFLTRILGEAPDPANLQNFQAVFNGESHAYEQFSGQDCYSVNIVPLRNDENEIYAGMAVIRDITQRVRVAEKLSNLAKRLKILNQMGQVVASNRNSEEIFREVTARVRTMIGAQGVFVFLEKNGRLMIRAQDEENQIDLRGQGMPSTDGIAGEVWQKQQSIIFSAEECRSKLFKPLAESLGYTPNSFIAVPISWQDRKFGVFEAVHREANWFDQEDLELVESAAAWMAIALNNAMQHGQLQRRLAESQTTTALLEEILSANLALDSVLQHVVEAGKSIVPQVDWAALHLLDERKNQLRLEAITGVHVAAEEYTLEAGSGIAGLVVESGKIINVGDVSQDERVASFPRTNRANSLLVAPIKNRQGTGIGTITLQSANTNQFTAEDESLLRLLAHQAGLAIENARLYETAEYGRQVAQVQRERLRQLTRQTVTAQEEERARLARELHDEAGQSLTALKISLEMLANNLPEEMQAARATVQEAAHQAGRTLENLRSMAHNLRPPALDRLGLNLALAGLCEQFEERTEIVTEYRGFELPRMRSSHEITLYRFVQEALTNIAKHAQASRVRVWLDTQTGLLEIHVQDNGRGMPANPLDPTNEPPRGMGLASMEERMAIINGQLKVESVPGAGTHLCTCVALEIREEPL